MQGSGDTLQQLKEAATSVGRTLSDGASALAETLSGWLAAPFGEEEEAAEQGRRTGSPRCGSDADERLLAILNLAVLLQPQAAMGIAMHWDTGEITLHTLKRVR